MNDEGYEVVENVERVRRYAIREWPDGQFDWYNDIGDESDVFFDTKEEAVADTRDR